MFFSPQLCVGFLFLILYPGLLLLLPPPPSHTHTHLVTSTFVSRGQTHIYCRFAWQAWHKLTSTVVLRGRRGTHGTGWRAWTGLGARDAAALCVAGAAQPHSCCRFTWQAWHRWHWVARLEWFTHTHSHTFTHTHTLGDIHLRFTWPNSHLPSFCVAGVALMALGGALGLAWAPVTPRHFAWQAWHNLTATVVLRGRRGTNSHPPSFCVAGVALMALGGALGLAWAPVTPRHFAWQAWHNLTATVVSRGRRGTNSHPPSFCVAGVVQMALGGALGVVHTHTHIHTHTHTHLLGDIHLRFTWPNSHLLSFCVAGVAQIHIHRRFAWPAWHSWRWVARLDWLGRP